MSVWVEARELKICMVMLCLLQHQTTYSDLDFFEIHLRVLLKNSEIFLENVNNLAISVWVETR
jgi:hypothetical protein